MRTVILLVAVLAHAAGLSAQTSYGETLLIPDEGGRMSAVSLRFPTGSAADLPGEEGSANLLGALVQEAANARLVASGGEVLVEVSAEEFLLTLLTPPERWRDGVAVVEGLLFGNDLAQAGASEFEEVRGQIVDVLRFESGSPVRAFEASRSALIRGPGSLGARPPMGSIESVGRLSMVALDRYRMENLNRGTAIVAIVGPVTSQEAEVAFGGPVRTVPLGGARPLPPLPAPEEPSPVSGGAPAPDLVTPATQFLPPTAPDTSPLRIPQVPGGPPAWTSGERIEVDQELTSTWIAAAFPLPEGTPSLLLEFLSHLVQEALSPSPPDPGLYQMESSLAWPSEKPVLVISASVDPRAAGRWEERILAVLPEIASSPPTGSFFELTRRRFRSNLLIGLAAPENRVRWAAREAARHGSGSVAVESDLWRLDREGVAELAGAALPPRIHLTGPLGMRTP